MCYNKLKLFPPNKSFFTYVTHNRNYDMISKMVVKNGCQKLFSKILKSIFVACQNE